MGDENKLKNENFEKKFQTGLKNSRPASRAARATPVEIAKANQACQKISNLLKQPGDVKKLKSAIKTEISQFDDDGGENVDLLVLKIELTRKAIDMCEKFKRKMLQHYLIYLLRSFKEDLKRITVQSSSINNNNSP